LRDDLGPEQAQQRQQLDKAEDVEELLKVEQADVAGVPLQWYTLFELAVLICNKGE
jgi:hypothetical protein